MICRNMLESRNLQWEEELYWTHFRSLHFLCYLSTGFYDHLAIPRKFAQKLRNRLPETPVLRGPSGETWDVSLISLNDDLYLGLDDHGWEEFVKDNCLQENDILMFKYNGISHFDVWVFRSETNCEKEASYFVKRSGNSWNQLEIGSKEDNKSNNKESIKWFEDIYWSNFRCVQFLQELSHDFHKQLVLPRKFCEKLMAKLPEIVILRCPSGATWNVQLSAAGQLLVLKDGWNEFVNAISLKEDDIMIFRFNMESRFDVLIFDSESMCEKASSYFVKPSECMRLGSPVAQREQFKTHCNQNTTSYDTTSRDDSARSSKRRKIISRRDSRRASANGGGVKSTTHVPRKRKLTEEERDKALRSASTASTDTSFIVVLSPTYVNKRSFLAIPKSWSQIYLHPETRQVVLRMKERTWCTSVWRYKSADMASFGSGWRAFVMDNRLRVSDVCVFTPADGPEPNPLIVDVMIFRPGQEERVTPAPNLVLNKEIES